MDQIRDAVQSYGLGGMMYLLAAAAWLYIFIGKSEEHKKVWVTYGIGVLLFVFPGGVFLLQRFGIERYSVLLLSLPSLVLFGIMGAELLSSRKTKLEYAEIIAAALILLIGSVQLNVNVYRINGLNPYDRVLKTESGNELLITDTDLTNRVSEDLQMQIVESKDEGFLFDALKARASYISLNASSTLLETAETYGLTRIKQLENNVLFANSKKDEDFSAGDTNYWKVTQYASNSGSQGMFYTVQDLVGHLILVDGGFEVDASQVKDVILAAGGHVDAWFLTHPDQDHGDAFNTLYLGFESYGITVDKIYVPDVNEERMRETAEDYNPTNTYDLFAMMTEGDARVVRIHENDEFDIIEGLHVQVIHAWNEQVDALEHNLTNNGSLMFKLTANTESMLFCGDVSSPMEEYILTNHAADLPSTYVQTGHHGNWGLSTAFYDVVNASGAFMDGPEYLYDGSDDMGYDGSVLKAYFENKGVPTYRFNTAPNSIVLK